MKNFAIAALLALLSQASQEMMVEQAETFIAEELASLSDCLEEPCASRKLAPSLFAEAVRVNATNGNANIDLDIAGLNRGKRADSPSPPPFTP